MKMKAIRPFEMCLFTIDKKQYLRKQEFSGQMVTRYHIPVENNLLLKASNLAKKKKYLLRNNSLKDNITIFDEHTASSLKPDSIMLKRQEGNTSHDFVLYM
jgi:hypothetical protein